MIFKVFSLKVKKMHGSASAALLDGGQKRGLALLAARVTYMQFILTKGASLSHCVPRERDRRWDRQRDLNSLFWDSRRHNSDGDESGLQRRRKSERSGGERERESKREEIPIILSPSPHCVQVSRKIPQNFDVPRVNTLRLKRTRYE